MCGVQIMINFRAITGIPRPIGKQSFLEEKVKELPFRSPQFSSSVPEYIVSLRVLPLFYSTIMTIPPAKTEVMKIVLIKMH